METTCEGNNKEGGELPGVARISTRERNVKRETISSWGNDGGMMGNDGGMMGELLYKYGYNFRDVKLFF